MRWLVVALALLIIGTSIITTFKIVIGVFLAGLVFWLVAGAYLWWRRRARSKA